MEEALSVAASVVWEWEWECSRFFLRLESGLGGRVRLACLPFECAFTRWDDVAGYGGMNDWSQSLGASVEG